MFGQGKSEIELIQASQRGDTQAFEAIVCKYQSLVCAITYSGTGSMDQSEELAQEILLLAWKNLKDLREPGRFQAWLCTIARNSVQNWRRTCGRQQGSRAAHMDAAAANQGASTAGPVDTAIQQEQEAVVNQALDRIPEKYREPLILFYRESKSVREVAVLLALSENTTRQRISRARKMLKHKVSHMVETTLSHSRPGKAFTTAVMSSVACSVLKTTATTAAVIGTASIVKGIFSGLAAKLAVTAAAVAIVGGGGVWWHQQQSEPVDPLDQTGEVTVQPYTEQTETLPSPVQDVISGNDESLETPTPSALPTNPNEPVKASQEVASSTAPEAPPIDAPLPVLKGTLTDIDSGKPIALAQIRMSPSGGGRVYQTVTDSNGTYAFEHVPEDGAYNLRPEPDEYITDASWESPNQTIELRAGRTFVKDFALEKGCRVNLKAIDESGRPIKGVSLFAAYVADDMGRGPKRPVRTRESGQTFLGGLRATEYLIVGAHQDYALAGQRITFLEPQEEQALVMEMKKGIEVIGIATCSDGLPASGWEVWPKPIWWHSTRSWPYDDPVAEDGTFMFRHIVPGLHRVEVSRPFDGGIINFWSTEVNLPSETGLLELAIPQPSSHSRVSISGTVVFKGDALNKGFSIDAYRKAGYFGHVDWEPDEPTFTIADLVPGLYDLTFTPPGGKRQTLKNIQAPSQNIVLEIQTNPWVPILGQVVDKLTGQPVTDFQVCHAGQQTWRQWSDPNGFFTLTNVNERSHKKQVIIRSQGYSETLSDEIIPESMDLLRIELGLPQALHGRIINEAGNPIEAAEVNYRYPRKSRDESPDARKITQSDALGYFDIPVELANTQEWFIFQHPDYARVIRQLDFRGDPLPELTVMLTQGGQVEGHLYDWQGHTLAHTPLYVMDESQYSYWNDHRGRLGRITTDANGFFHIDHLPEELCFIFREDPEQRLGTVQISILPSQEQTRTVNINGPWRATGRLLKNGIPLANMKLMINYDHSYVQGFKAYTLTNDLGEFTFFGLPTGQRSLYVEDQNNDWLIIGTYDFTAGCDLNLNDLEISLTKVIVALTKEDQSSLGHGWDVRIQQHKEKGLRMRNMGQAIPRQNQNDPFVFNNLPPGQFKILAQCTGYPSIRQSFEILPGQETQSVNLVFPTGSAGLTGQITLVSAAKNPSHVTLCNRDQTVVESLPVGVDGAFSMKHLPAGNYTLLRPGVLSTDRSDPLCKIQLTPGEHKTIDLLYSDDASVDSYDGYLVILVVNEQGLPTVTPDAWLEQKGRTIEAHMSTDNRKWFRGHPGRYMLHVQYPGFKPIQKSIEMKGKQDRATQEILEPVVVVLKKVES